MRFTKSIRWRLLSWITVLLGCSLLALDFAAYEIHFSNRGSLLDEELRRRVAALSASVFAPMDRGPFHNPPPGDLRNPPPGDRPPGPPPDSFNGGPPQDGGGPGSHFSPARAHAPGPPPLDEAKIAAAEIKYESEGDGGFYFVIWRSGSAAPYRESTNHPAGAAHPQGAELDTGTYTRTRDGFREAYHTTEHGDCILVGRTLAPVLADAQRFGGLLGLGSLIVLGFGLGGAWLIIAGALRPLEKISAAAANISSGNLSQRINVSETESELGQVAAVLNSTFARLDAAFTRQKQFTADAAHELRTPVSIMLTHAQNGLASHCNCDEHREAFAACQRAAQRMKKLIGALLALARLDDAQATARRRLFNLAHTVRDCVELVQPLANDHRVKIFAELREVPFFGDEEQLAQVITNLLVNAVQYNRAGGEVRVTLESSELQLVLAVSDNGAGIAPEDLPHVFERFYRADKSRAPGGLGLGLAISKAIVAVHNGTITVSSLENIKTAFTVILPQAADLNKLKPGRNSVLTN